MRFLLVGCFGEMVYLGLYAAVWQASNRAMISITVAGLICVVINAFLHARISFRVRFRLRLLLSYLLVQGICLTSTLAAGWALEVLGASALVVATLTMLMWSSASFLLTRHSFLPLRRGGMKT